MPNNIAYTTAKFVLIDLIGDILYFPVWWYTKGLVKTGIFCLKSIKDKEESLGVMIWIRNVFTPMFGQYDIEGRIISFFARIFQIFFRVIAFILWIIFIVALFILWIILPVVIIQQLISHSFISI